MRLGSAEIGRVAAVAALFVFGCASTEVRVARYVDEYHGVIVSNSPMLLERPQPRVDGDGLVVVYSLLLENVGEDSITAGFAYAGVRVGPSAGRAACHVGARSVDVLELRPGDRWRVDCRLALSQAAVRIVRAADTNVSLSIPLRSPLGRAEVHLSYLLRVEDVS